MKSVNTFNEGMDRDSSQNKRSNASYYDALDLRIISDDSLSNGALVNFNGTKAKIDLIDRDHKLIGYTTIKDTLIVFLLDTSTGDSKIYKVNVNNTDSVQSLTLVYSDASSTSKLSFNADYPIKAVGRYETSTIQKVYWVDGLNEFRYINIMDTHTGKEADYFDTVVDYIGKQLTVELIESGGNLKSGKIAYAYKTYNNNGAESSMSPVSDFIPLAESKRSFVRYDNHKGSENGVDVGKSVKYSLDISNFTSVGERIKIYSLFYTSDSEIPEISCILDTAIPSNGIIEGVDSGSTVIESITTEQFITEKRVISPSIIEAKKNLLFLGGITEDNFDIDFDARAYRFDSEPKATVMEDTNDITDPGGTTFYVIQSNGDWDKKNNTNGTITTVDSGTDWSIPEDANVINRFNNIDNDVVDDSSTVSTKNGIYKSNGSDLGGTGKNVSFSILTRAANTFSLGSLNPIVNSDDYRYYKRGETYRFGIIFKDRKGRSSFVKWVADIRMPLHKQGDPYYDSGFDSHFYYPRMHVDLSSLSASDKAKIRSIEVVRVKREANDRSIIGQGIVRTTILDGPNSLYYKNNGAQNGGDSSFNLITFDSTDIQLNLTNKVDGFYIDSYAIYNGGVNHDFTSGSYTVNKRKTIDYSKIVDITESDGAVNKVGSSLSYDYINRGLDAVGNDDQYSSKCLVLETDTLFTTVGTGFILAEIKSNIFESQYGGITYNARKLNNYINASSPTLVSVADTYDVSSFYGDTYITRAEILSSYMDQATLDTSNRDYIDNIMLETYYNNYYFLNESFTNYNTESVKAELDVNFGIMNTVAKGVEKWSIKYPVDIGDLYRFNNAYSQERLYPKFLPKPDNFTLQSELNNTIISSEEKFNGEIIDNWTIFLYNNFIEVESEYGSLIDLIQFKNKLYFFQEEGVGVLAVNDRVLLSNTGDATQLALGTGGVLERYDYLNTDVGVTASECLVQSNSDVYLLDLNNKIITSLSKLDSPISLTKNVNSLVRSLIEIGEQSSHNIAIGYDPIYKEILFTINETTLCYNEYTGAFISRYSTIAKKYIQLKNSLMSYIENEDIVDTDRYLFNHNKGEKGDVYSEVIDGDKSTSSVVVLNNPNGTQVNSYDILEFRTDVSNEGENLPDDFDIVDETVSSICFKNSYLSLCQDTVIKNPYTYGKKIIGITDNLESSTLNAITYQIDYLISEEISASFDIRINNTGSVPIYRTKISAVSSGQQEITTSVYLDNSNEWQTVNTGFTLNPSNIEYISIMFDSVGFVDFGDITDLDIDLRNVQFTLRYNQPFNPDLNIVNIRGSINKTEIKTVDVSNYNTANTSRTARCWTTRVPVTADGDRFVDQYLLTTLNFDNNNNKLFKLHDLITHYRSSNRV